MGARFYWLPLMRFTRPAKRQLVQFVEGKMATRRSQADAAGSERNRRTELSANGSIEPPTPGRQGFVAAYRDFTEEIDLATLALDPGELFGSIRKEAQGRDVRL